MDPFPKDRIHTLICHECKPLHKGIVARFFSLLDDSQTRKTHFFNGRYENIYIAENQLTEIRPVLAMIFEEASRLLNCDKQDLSIGFWFNLMQKDDVTLAHTHDDDDELLSGTYYLQTPENSGKLTITPDNAEAVTIEPQEATLVFFHPEQKHEVSQHYSLTPRISIGFNIGAKVNRHELSD